MAKDMTQGMQRVTGKKKKVKSKDENQTAFENGDKPKSKKKKPKEGQVAFFDGANGSKIRGEYHVLDIDSIRPNAYNPNQVPPFVFEKLKDNIRKGGFTDPIFVRSGDDNGKFEDGLYEIVDGEHRWRAATDLGMVRIPVIDLGIVSDNEAKTLTITFNELKGRPDEDALAALVTGIGIDSDLAALLPYDEKELEAMQQLGGADWSALDTLPEGDNDDLPDDADGDEDELIGVIEYLSLEDMTDEQSVSMRHRLERVAKFIKYNPRRAGSLLDALISYYMKQNQISEFEDDDEDDADEE